MTEISGILSGSDNLWKYLFTVGVLLIAISIFYPLKQSETIDLKIIDLYTDSKRLEQKIKHLKEDNVTFNNYLNIATKEVDSLRTLKNQATILLRISTIETEIASEKKMIKNKIRELQLLIIENQGKENYIVELKNQSYKYKKFFYLGVILGIILLLLGLYKWLMATTASDKLRWKELGESEKDTLREFLKDIKLFKRGNTENNH